MLSSTRARALKPLLDAFAGKADWAERKRFDPIEFPGRYQAARDVEVAGLLGSALAYGRADLFKPKVDGLLAQMGRSPAAYVAELDVKRAAKLLDGFVYRFNLPADVAVLLMGMGAVLRERGSLEAAFEGETQHARLANLTKTVRGAAPLKLITKHLGKTRGLAHLLPSPLGPGAAKRLNLFLRWMVRGPDGTDFGVWRVVKPAQLIIPLDTHVMRIAKLLGLTARNDASWRTAEEVTASLRLLDASDPVRYDFALCHYGMSGACPAVPIRDNCLTCELKGACRRGRVLRQTGPASSGQC
ncbi:MAG: TIGR02757 family protein [Myxococcaceae bacterium]|nr:TIGR02757 family protein [Myxococcaceae bacterium]